MRETESATAAVLAVALALVLAACAATPYQPKTRGYGYSEQRLEADRYRVAFAGNSRTSRDAVQNYVMYRAAELTLQNGYDHFILVGTTTQGEPGRSPGVGVSLGGFRFGGSTGIGIGVGTSTGGDSTAYRGQADIIMRTGPKPDDLQAFDAREVKANLEATIRRPAGS